MCGPFLGFNLNSVKHFGFRYQIAHKCAYSQQASSDVVVNEAKEGEDEENLAEDVVAAREPLKVAETILADIKKRWTKDVLTSKGRAARLRQSLKGEDHPILIFLFPFPPSDLDTLLHRSIID